MTTTTPKPAAPKTVKYLSPAEVAERTGRSQRAIRRLVRKGVVKARATDNNRWEIPATEVPRIKKLSEVS